MLKKYIQFIKESQLEDITKEHHSVGEYIENVTGDNEYLLNIIRDVAKDNNIFIISHKEHMNEKFTNVLKFVKHKNFSQIQG